MPGLKLTHVSKRGPRWHHQFDLLYHTQMLNLNEYDSFMVFFSCHFAQSTVPGQQTQQRPPGDVPNFTLYPAIMFITGNKLYQFHLFLCIFCQIAYTQIADLRVDIGETSIRHKSVGSMFNRCRSAGLCYLGRMVNTVADHCTNTSII